MLDLASSTLKFIATYFRFANTSDISVFGTIYGDILFLIMVRCSKAYASPMSLASVKGRPRSDKPKGMFGPEVTCLRQRTGMINFSIEQCFTYQPEGILDNGGIAGKITER